jgi:hypothetical protein
LSHYLVALIKGADIARADRSFSKSSSRLEKYTVARFNPERIEQIVHKSIIEHVAKQLMLLCTQYEAFHTEHTTKKRAMQNAHE